MAAEIEVFKVFEVAEILEKPELGLSSDKDPYKSNCNGINHQNQSYDLDNSCVFVTDSNSIGDGTINNKDVIAKDLSVLSESNTVVEDRVAELNDKNENLDNVNCEVSDLLNDGDYGNVEETEEYPPLVSRSARKQESFREDEGGFQVRFANCCGKTESWVDVLKNPSMPLVVKVKPRVSSSMDAKNEKRDTMNGEVSEPPYDRKNGNVEETGNNAGGENATLVNGSSSEHESFIENKDGFQVCSFNPPEMHYGKGKSCGGVSKNTNDSFRLHQRANGMVSTVSRVPTFECKQETSLENVTSNGKLLNNKKVGLVVVSGRESKDEDELTRKAEELRRKEAEEMKRKEAESKLKEQCRLEELAKANKAHERKKQQSELKELKGAEEKEKERQKRLRKKERKKAAKNDVNNMNNNCAIASSSETAVDLIKDIEAKDNMLSVMRKEPQKPRSFSKKSKTKSVPPLLRNRNKKIYQQLMRVALISFAIFVLFWLGNKL